MKGPVSLTSFLKRKAQYRQWLASRRLKKFNERLIVLDERRIERRSSYSTAIEGGGEYSGVLQITRLIFVTIIDDLSKFLAALPRIFAIDQTYLGWNQPRSFAVETIFCWDSWVSFMFFCGSFPVL